MYAPDKAHAFAAGRLDIVVDGQGPERPADPRARPDADLNATAVTLVGLLRGIALQLISTPHPARVKAIIEEAERSTRRAIGP